MRVNADTNLLLRYIMPEDDPLQHLAAVSILERAESIYVALPTLCELVWVLGSAFRFGRPAIARSVRALLETKGIRYDRLPAQRGLALLEAGGDFADGAIAELGYLEGDFVFASFDKGAVDRLARMGLTSVLAEVASD